MGDRVALDSKGFLKQLELFRSLVWCGNLLPSTLRYGSPGPWADTSHLLPSFARLRNPWLKTEKLVAKPDQMIGGRGKAGLIAVNKTFDDVKAIGILWGLVGIPEAWC